MVKSSSQAKSNLLKALIISIKLLILPKNQLEERHVVTLQPMSNYLTISEAYLPRLLRLKPEAMIKVDSPLMLKVEDVKSVVARVSHAFQ